MRLSRVGTECPPPPSIPPAPSEGGPDRHHARLRSLAPPWLTPACCSWFSKNLLFFFLPTSLLALRSKMKHLAHKQCDGAIRDFVQCSKEAGILVVIKCREHNKRMNECVSD